MDYLMASGHGAKVWDYTLRQIELFSSVAIEREKARQPNFF